MDSNGAGVKQQLLDTQMDQQQQQQPVAKRRHVVNVADACIAEGGSSAAPIEGSAPGSSSSASNWILIDDDNIDTVTWSRSDRDPLLSLSADKLHVKGEKGYRSIRATHFLREGTWFHEVTVHLSAPGSAVRIGWGSEGCDNDSPVGFNAFGWSIKSTDGCIYHRADSRPYARAPIFNGDVIGCLLHLAAPVDGARPLPSGGSVVLHRSMKWWGPTVGAFNPVRAAAPGSFIKFFKNGVDLGVAAEDIMFDNMYPTVSIFGGASVTANFGATPFAFPPPSLEGDIGCDWAAVETRARESPPWLEHLQRFKAEEEQRKEEEERLREEKKSKSKSMSVAASAASAAAASVAFAANVKKEDFSFKNEEDSSALS